MFDVGLGEILVLLVLALLVFGPDRLPQVTAQATHWLRQLREQAASARAEIVDAVDVDATGIKDLVDLHPKRLAASVLAPVDDVARTVKDAGASVSEAVNGVGSAPASPSTPGAAPDAPPAPGSSLFPYAAPFDPDAT